MASADTALNPRQRVADIVGYPLALLLGLSGRRKRDRAAELLDLVGLPPDTHAGGFPGQLSGGQKQRVGSPRARRRATTRHP